MKCSPRGRASWGSASARPATDAIAETAATSLYETDHYAWTQQQAAEPRRLAERLANIPLDLANLAEEVADLGKGE